ncbi:energy transducer TonB [Sphingomonas hylomeconis]|uniref:Protein TonB n=1 Tax=Sphingomonas hylomeconis TaxID=1395958 RepID=A0ABV7SNW4_9SPHN|nr:energy transducer TonB [Sphingomonas hylomeconis]
MYADRYGKSGIKPGALSIAIGLNGAIIAALIFSTPDIVKSIDKTFIARPIPLPVDPPPLPDPKPKTETKVRTEQRVIDPPPRQRPTLTETVAPTNTGNFFEPGPPGLDGGVTGGTGTIEPPYIPPHVPVLVGARPDPRFAKAFQPAYPPGERRAEREGRVTVRVLIGTDGRVKQVERVSAASEAFFAATREQALAKWRFTPATRDGIPQEVWRTMSVSFVLDDAD